MIPANKSAWFERLFRLYTRNLFWRRFQALRLAGLENLRGRNKNLPLILYANHSSWWDGLVAFEIGRKTNLDQFVMMEEKQLRQLFLFRRLGAFSIIRENPRDAIKSINYAVSLLKEKPNRALWIFPQGEILPNDLRPLKLYNGLSKIIERTGKCYAVPVAMRYEFLSDFKPKAFARIGEPELVKNLPNAKNLTLHFAEKLTVMLDYAKADILKGSFD